MTYVCSDIHGCSDKYLNLLEEINFKESDALYVLGDVLDREGSGGIDVLQDIMNATNVTLILGNHEEAAREGMEFLMNAQAQSAFDVDGLPASIKSMLAEWINLGGMPTIDAFRELPRREQERMVRFLPDRCPTCAELTVNETDYVLCHDESCYGDAYDAVLITGHIPTRNMNGNPKPDYIWRDGEHWHIDCGCGYGGQLARCVWKQARNFIFDLEIRRKLHAWTDTVKKRVSDGIRGAGFPILKKPYMSEKYKTIVFCMRRKINAFGIKTGRGAFYPWRYLLCQP